MIQDPPITFGTKAETLARLAPRVRHADVLPSRHFTVERWRTRRAEVIAEILGEAWGGGALAVRSSALVEDAMTGSQAGRFHTELNVRGTAELVAAVDRVVRSYTDAEPGDQVLVQPWLSTSRASGVGCSCDPSSGAGYHVVTWSAGPDTTAVTGGRVDGVRTWYTVPGHRASTPPEKFLTVVSELLTELRHLCGHDRLEVEFAVAPDDTLVLLQVRPLVVKASEARRRDHRRALTGISFAGPDTTGIVLGSRRVFGVMPDWNPAEIIGLRPRPLSLSLYQRLVTDLTWARARRSFGYRDLRGTPLVSDFAGIPYVDVGASFTSFIPADRRTMTKWNSRSWCPAVPPICRGSCVAWWTRASIASTPPPSAGS